MKDIRKIKKYANALMSVSKSDNINDTVQGLVSFKNILKEFPDLRYLLSSKKVSVDNKIKSTKNIFSRYYNNISMEFILLLIENNDISIYSDILDKIITLMESSSSTKKIQITSHKEYSKQDQSEILSAIKDKFNINDSSEADFNVDSKILGGIKVRIGNKIIDGSVSTKLKKIKQSLLGI